MQLSRAHRKVKWRQSANQQGDSAHRGQGRHRAPRKADPKPKDHNADEQPDIVKHYAESALLREETDRDFDGRFEMVTAYANGQRTTAKIDADGDGRTDVAMEYENDRLARQSEDLDFDGRNDVVTTFDAEERPARVYEDSDADGSFDTTTFYTEGARVRTEKDRNADGKADLFAYYEGDAVVRQEEDKDFDGTIDVRNIRRQHTRLAMPNWTPGAYGIGRYGERVEDLRATTADGRALDFTRADHQTWSIATSSVDALRVSYHLPRRRGFFSRGQSAAEPTGLRISGPSTYLYVVGAKDRPVSVRYRLPDGWKVANGLHVSKGGGGLVRHAKDYDTFIDAPSIVGIFREHDFEVAGTAFQCVFFENSQRYDFDVEGFVDVCPYERRSISIPIMFTLTR